MRVFLRVYPYLLFVMCFITGSLAAQELEPGLVRAKVLQGEIYTLEVATHLNASIISSEDYGEGSFTMTGNGVGTMFTYQSDPNFIGESRFVIERYGLVGSNKQYTEVFVRVVPSLIEANSDAVLLASDDSSVTIDALSNDNQGWGTSTISSLDLVSDGSASIVNNQIVFTKAVGFSGLTSFNYTIEDASGYRSSGVVSVLVSDGSELAGGVLNYITASDASLDIIVDDPSYRLADDQTLGLGELSLINGIALKYTPRIASIGSETFTLVNDAGEQIEVNIDIWDDQSSSLSIRDDVYYTSKETAISFDPRENDLNIDGILLDYSDELSFDGTSFTYTPSQGYSGVKEFFYTVLEGQKEIEGSIELYVGNYLPQLDAYTFQTYENTAFLIEYLAPITNYQWSLVSAPSDGFLEFNKGAHVYSCGVASGKRMTIYDPYAGFVGTDQFTIEYCVDNGACKEVDITIEVIPADESCPCIGNDCVWPGDADNDGKVSVKDVLAIGYNYGETGFFRSKSSSEWGANHSADWAFMQDESDVNNKYADSDGNGIVNSNDAVFLNENINQYHNINAQEVLAQKDIPLSFVETSTGPYVIGDIITFDVIVGSEAIPAEDLRGIVFSLAFPQDLVDTESIKFTPSEEWLGSGSPILSAVDVTNGVLSAGISRTADIGVFGNGRIGETSLIIVEDVDGTRPGDEEFPIDIKFNSARVNNSIGKSYKIPGESLKFTVQLDQSKLSDEPEVLVFPNPSQDLLTFHANNNDELVDVQIYNMMGALMIERIGVDAKTIDIQHNLPQGVYTASVKTQKGYTVEKIQVLGTR